MEIIVITSILLASILLPLLMVNRVFLASDNKIQLSIVDQIRSNKHRFILEHKSFLFCKKMMYPQFLFWVLSYLSLKQYKWASRYLFILFHFFSAAAFIAFLVMLYPEISESIGLPLDKVLLYAGVIYILTPFSYNINNAKNTGISTRGLGLLLGQIILYSLILYLYCGTIGYLILASFCIWITLLGSVFALQMLIFIIPPFALISGEWLLITPLIGAFAFFFLSKPQYARNYVKGQYGHKRFYFKYLAKNHLLAKRYSVWRDLVWDFWIIAFNKFRRDGKVSKGLMYMYDNPAVSVIVGMPFCIPIVFLELRHAYVTEGLLDHDASRISLVILLCFGVFLFTSFRITRFLGEPERYLEFANGLIAIVSLYWFGDTPELLNYMIVFCALISILQVVGLRIRLKEKAQPGFFDDIKQLEAYIDQKDSMTIKILSNDNQVCKLLLSDKTEVFFGWPYSDRIGSFHYTEIYTADQFIKPDKIRAIAEEFDIDYFVLHKKELPPTDPIIAEDNMFEPMQDYKELALYKIRKNN